MKRISLIMWLLFSFVFAFNTMAADLPRRVVGHESVFHGGNAEFNKSGADTIVLIGPWGSGAQANGQFQDTAGDPAWNGWTHWDVTQPTLTHWQVSNYAASNLPGGPGNLAAFCGDETYPSCEPLDPIGGYGNNWHDILEFRYAVANAAEDCTMQVSGVFNSNTEPGYDYVTFRYLTPDAPVVTETLDGIHQAQFFNYSHNYGPDDYVGVNSDEVLFQILITTDGGWSDEDCDYWSNGACQIDDLRVQCTNGSYDGFTDFQDGTLGSWNNTYPVGVGDFTDLWVGLEDIDPCHTNYSPQVAFIDDGTKVPYVGPSYCQNWCYGPGGYIVNTTGGATEDGHLLNELESPVVSWPGSDYIGAELDFGVYRHEDLTDDAPYIFYSWAVRSTANEITAPIAVQPWEDRNFVYFGGPEYVRPELVVSDLRVPGATHFQVRLECNQLGYMGVFTGDDGYPAPYFDNVRLKAYQAYGPAMSARDIDLAQDNFSAIGEEVDFTNLAINNVRFDSALSKAVGGEEHNIPGDSIVCSVASIRAGGELVSNRLVYTMLRNPVFDSVRDPLWSASGFTDGIRQGTTDKYFYDLPDSSFLFPGDVLHYYFEATDEAAHSDPQISTIPEDLTGFGQFNNSTLYDTNFQVRALPSIKADGSHPAILFWNDFAQGGGEDEWYTAMANLGLELGVHYDAYHTNSPTSGVGNGLGGRAVYEQIKGYTELLYTCGDLGVSTISNGDFQSDASRDIQLLQDWLAFGAGRDVFLCGDELASDMNKSGSLTCEFMNDMMNVQWVSNDLRPLINSQTTPLVLPESGNRIFYTTEGWISFGGCLGINTFDAVTAGPGAERLARFSNPSGIPDYAYSAATLNFHDNDRILTMPYDFMSIYTDPGHIPGYGLSARANILYEILSYFQVSNGSWPSSQGPIANKFFTSNYPNPFNPTTEIKFNMPIEGHLSLKIFNVRGELVKTLIDETRPMGGGQVFWDGTNDEGSSVSSGVYFYEARTGGEVQVSKMALVK